MALHILEKRDARDGVMTTAVPLCTVEVVSDSGEGAQKCGQAFGAMSAKMGNGVWTVEIIPAEIQPPPRIPVGASGIRIRVGSKIVTNWGDRANLCVAFNEQVLLARHRLNALEDDAIILIENMWASHKDEDIQAEWKEAMEELAPSAYRIIEVPMEEQCLTLVDDARKGKNMFALGLLCWIFDRDMELASSGEIFSTDSTRLVAPLAGAAVRRSRPLPPQTSRMALPCRRVCGPGDVQREP